MVTQLMPVSVGLFSPDNNGGFFFFCVSVLCFLCSSIQEWGEGTEQPIVAWSLGRPSQFKCHWHGVRIVELSVTELTAPSCGRLGTRTSSAWPLLLQCDSVSLPLSLCVCISDVWLSTEMKPDTSRLRIDIYWSAMDGWRRGDGKKKRL